MNQINLIGRVCSKPTFYEIDGQKMAKFHLQSKEVIIDTHGNPRNISEKHRVVVKGSAVNLLLAVEVQHTSVAVEGKMKYNYFNVLGGPARCVPEILANDLIVI